MNISGRNGKYWKTTGQLRNTDKEAKQTHKTKTNQQQQQTKAPASRRKVANFLLVPLSWGLALLIRVGFFFFLVHCPWELRPGVSF